MFTADGQGGVKAFVSAAGTAGRRVDAWTAEVFRVSRSRAVDLIRAGAVTLNGQPVKPHRAVRPGDVLRGEVPPAGDPAIAAESGLGPVPVVFADAHLLVVDKPAGLTVHPGAGRRSGTLVNALLGMGVPLAPAAGKLRPGVVHRLDRGTSGLMVLAKTDEAYWKLARMAMRHELEREYLAVVAGRPRPASGTIEGALARDPRNREKFAVVAAGGRRAVTHYRVERELDGASLVRITLDTGRTHQIRVHFAALGWPVFGDRVYGRSGPPSGSPAIGRQALHAARLAFPHPVAGRPVNLSSELPPDIRELVERLAGRGKAA